MTNNKHINIQMIIQLAKRLGDLRKFLAMTFRALMANDEFLDAIPGHLLPDHASQARLPRLIKKLEEIAEISNQITD